MLKKKVMIFVSCLFQYIKDKIIKQARRRINKYTKLLLTQIYSFTGNPTAKLVVIQPRIIISLSCNKGRLILCWLTKGEHNKDGDWY